jgi:Cu2+-exporting ATPase
MSSADTSTVSAANFTSVAEGSCFHCAQPLVANNIWERSIAGEQQQFCCPACEAVCVAIYDGGLEGFYQRTPDGTPLAPPPETPKELALYDLDDVQAEYVDSLGREREINLLLEGIHCAACVWLIERSLATLSGIKSAKVNLSGKRLTVAWDNEETQLSKVIQHLSQVGYAAVPYDPEVAEGSIKKQNRAMLLRMAFAGFCMMNLLWVSIALYSGADQGEFRDMFHWIGFALATPTLLYSGYPFLKGALTGLRRWHLTMDLPIAIGASVTYFYSVYVTVTQSTTGHVYFDTVVNFIFVILVGRYLEAMSKRQAVASTQRLLDLQPRGATILVDGVEKVLPIRAVKVGDTVIVKAGDKIPVDGRIIEGSSAVDESMLSGESAAAKKICGDKVSAGTINIDSALILEVVGTMKDTALGRIIRLVENAQQSKAPIQCITDRIVPWFVLGTLTLASLTYFLWAHTGLEHALMAATAVLIITCPCAFGLATPMSIAVASGLGARNGVLIKSSDVFENLSTINHVVFDKTGTLTEGRMSVHGVVTVDDINHEEVLLTAAALEQYSEHSIAKAILGEAENHGNRHHAHKVSEFSNHAGYGVSASVNDVVCFLGSMNWLQRNGIAEDSPLQQQAKQWESDGITCVYLAIDRRLVGIIAIADQLRGDAQSLVEKLRNSGIKMTLLSGDRKPVADAIAAELGGMDVIAEVLPQDKDSVIHQLQQQGERVAMVGDGINDAPALMRADVGIAIGSGTDVSIDSADIVLMSDELEKVWLAKQLSKRTLKTIRQNIGISFLYNIIMVPMAMMALVTPLVAAIAMPISSLAVIGNSARIRSLFNK